MAQEFGGGLQSTFCFGSFMKLVRCQWGLQSSEVLSEAGDLFPGSSLRRLASFCWLSARSLSSSPCECLHEASWVSSQHGGWLPPEKTILVCKEELQFCDLTLEVTYSHVCSILLVTQVSSDSLWNYIRAWMPGGMDDWEPSWRLAATNTSALPSHFKTPDVWNICTKEAGHHSLRLLYFP